ncbi:FAD-binding protein, partial [Candidatus Bathyarchaeota archaeon]|nr:FAD-binding protein [Candidatus Bathyarchaeota archaeon]
LGLTIPLKEYAGSKGIRFLDGVIITRLLRDEGGVVGAVGYDIQGDRPVVFSSGAVILATGGAGALYKRTDCPVRTTGDGYTLAFEVGATLRDMEFVQFYPIALAEEGAPPYLIGGYMAEEGHIINSLGEEIPKKHGVKARPLALKSRDLLSRAVMIEILEGRDVEGAVLLDAREAVRRRGEEGWFSTGPYRFFAETLRAGERPLKVAPVSHFCMGGVVIDEYGSTGIPGLYAAGEVVGGVHGANRHGGNALTEAIVFGARAGAAAASHGRTAARIDVKPLASSEIERYEGIRKGGGVDPEDVMRRLREVMWEKAGIVRGEEGLREALAEVERMMGEQHRPKALSGRRMLEALEAPMALKAAEMIIRSALERRESRGAHYRVDYPDEDPSWLRMVVIRRSQEGLMTLTTSAI